MLQHRMGCNSSKAGGDPGAFDPPIPDTAGQTLKQDITANDKSSSNAESAARRLSLKSEGAMQALAECQQQLDAYSASVSSIEASLDNEAEVAANSPNKTGAGGHEAQSRLAPLRASLAQLNGSVEKLQAVKIDAVQVSDLSSGMDDARTKRKTLNQEVFSLAERISAAHTRLEKLTAAFAVPHSSPSVPPDAATHLRSDAPDNGEADQGANGSKGVECMSEIADSKADRRKRVAELIRAKKEQRESCVDAAADATPAPNAAVASMSHALQL